MPQICLAQSVEAERQLPTLPSTWQGSRTEDKCSIWRSDKKRFEFFWINLDGSLQLRIHDAGWSFVARETVPFRFEIGDEKIPGTVATALTTNNMAGFVATIPAAVANDALDDAQVRLTIDPPVDEIVPLESLGELFGWLRQCRAALPPYDPETAVVSPPVLVSSVDGQAFADLPRAPGPLSYVLSINADGRVDSCQVTQTSGNSAADVRICQILSEKMRFEPALNEAGNPVKGTYRSGVAFGN